MMPNSSDSQPLLTVLIIDEKFLLQALKEKSGVMTGSTSARERPVTRTRSVDRTIVDVAPSFGSNQLLSTLERRFALFTLCTNNDISVLVVGANS